MPSQGEFEPLHRNPSICRFNFLSVIATATKVYETYKRLAKHRSVSKGQFTGT